MIKGGPKIINDGLVLCLDAHDAKSYAGEPTQNYFINTASTGGWWGDGSNQTIGSKGVVAITDENLKYNGYPTVLWTPGSSRNAYLNGSSDIDTSATSTEWTFSVYAKYEDGSDFSSMNVYLYYPSSDGSAAGTITDVGNGWKRISRTRTGSSNYINLAGITGISSNKKIYLSGWQLEKKQYITPVVGVNSSRSATDGWVDRTTNNNDGTLTNMVGTGASHYRDGQVIMPVSASYLEFDGSDDYVTIGTNPTGIDQVQVPLTICAWVWADSFGSYDPIWAADKSTSGGGLYSMLRVDSGTLKYFTTDSTGGIQSRSGPSLSTNTWYFLAATVSGTTSSATVNFYLNGSLSSSSALSVMYSSPMANVEFRIGANERTSGERWDGKIPIVYWYNKALTAAEVLQNYNATKGRFL